MPAAHYIIIYVHHCMLTTRARATIRQPRLSVSISPNKGSQVSTVESGRFVLAGGSLKACRMHSGSWGNESTGGANAHLTAIPPWERRQGEHCRDSQAARQLVAKAQSLSSTGRSGERRPRARAQVAWAPQPPAALHL